MKTYYFENYKYLVPANVIELFDRNLVFGISELKAKKYAHVRLICLWWPDGITFEDVIDASNEGNGRFDGKFYISGQETGWFVVDGRAVDITVTEVENTRAFREMYTEYMKKHGIGLTRYEKFLKAFRQFLKAFGKVNVEET